MAGSAFITGDTHRHLDITKLTSRHWPEGKKLDKDDFLLIGGDVGIVWGDDAHDKCWLDWFENKPWTTLFVDGNHDNHDLLDALPVEIWHGGKIHRLRDSIIHLMRGQIYDIHGVKIFTMGGATSHDRERRREGIDWWARELPSDAEYAEAWANLERCGFEVEVILTHCGPVEVERSLGYYEHDHLNWFLQKIYDRCKFKQWYMGHYHMDVDLNDRVHILYNRIVPLVNTGLNKSQHSEANKESVDPVLLPEKFEEIPKGWRQLAIEYAKELQSLGEEFGFAVKKITWKNKTGALVMSTETTESVPHSVNMLIKRASMAAEVKSTYLCQRCGKDEGVLLVENPFDAKGAFLCSDCACRTKVKG